MLHALLNVDEVRRHGPAPEKAPLDVEDARRDRRLQHHAHSVAQHPVVSVRDVQGPGVRGGVDVRTVGKEASGVHGASVHSTLACDDEGKSYALPDGVNRRRGSLEGF